MMTESIQLPLIGIGTKHQPGFTIDRPTGTPFFVFIQFVGPIQLHDRTGTHWHMQGATILYESGFRQWYSAGDYDMEHSWFHCTGDGIPTCIQRYDLPVNIAVAGLPPIGDLGSFLQSVQRERLRAEPHWEDVVTARAAAFFVLLSRAIQQQRDTRFTAYQREQRDLLRRLRADIHAELVRPWTIPEMASLANLSPSRFSALYLRFFGKSPLDDLIESRLHRADSLLGQTSLPIEAIAEQCGFHSLAHFSRLFRKHRGVSPSQFRLSDTFGAS